MGRNRNKKTRRQNRALERKIKSAKATIEELIKSLSEKMAKVQAQEDWLIVVLSTILKDDLNASEKRILTLLLEKRDLLQRQVNARNERKRSKEERRRKGEQVSDTDSESESDIFDPISPAGFSDSDSNQDPPPPGGASTAVIPV